MSSAIDGSFCHASVTLKDHFLNHAAATNPWNTQNLILANFYDFCGNTKGVQLFNVR